MTADQDSAEGTWRGRTTPPESPATAPHRISLRHTARLLRLPLKGGVIPGTNRERRLHFRPGTWFTPARETGKTPHASLKYHSPLEGESERQGRSPPSSRRGADTASRKSRSAAFAEPRSETDLLQRHASPQSCAGVCPPPHQPSPYGSTSATPPQGGSDTGH